jgi:hypothetical protein
LFLCFGHGAKSCRQHTKALPEDGGLRHDEPKDNGHEQDLSETIDRSGAQEENEYEGRNDYRARPDHGSAARDSDPNEKSDTSGEQHPISIDTTPQGRPDQEASGQGEIRDHSHDKREWPGRSNFSQRSHDLLSLPAGRSIEP